MLARPVDRRLRTVEYMNPIIGNEDSEGMEVASASRSRRTELACLSCDFCQASDNFVQVRKDAAGNRLAHLIYSTLSKV